MPRRANVVRSGSVLTGEEANRLPVYGRQYTGHAETDGAGVGVGGGAGIVGTATTEHLAPGHQLGMYLKPDYGLKLHRFNPLGNANSIAIMAMADKKEGGLCQSQWYWVNKHHCLCYNGSLGM